MNGVCVLTEVWRDALSEVSFELLALGRKLADQLHVPLEAVVLGNRVRQHAAALGAADRVFVADHPTLDDAVPNAWAAALATVLATQQPRIILLGLTNVSLGVGTLLAAHIERPVVNFCVDVLVEDDQLAARCVMFAGKIEARVAVAGSPAIFCLWPGSYPPDSGRRTREDIEVVEIPFAPADPLPVRLKRRLEPEAGDIDITRLDALVAVGRGMQSRENVAAAEQLAEALGGAVCGSRPVIDQGWLPLSRQVGKSGVTVKPRLYVALGVSGAPEHVEGMRDSALIVAVNTDPQAPIFNVAHYGIVADAVEAAEALVEAVKRVKAAHA